MKLGERFANDRMEGVTVQGRKESLKVVLAKFKKKDEESNRVSASRCVDGTCGSSEREEEVRPGRGIRVRCATRCVLQSTYWKSGASS